MLRTNLSTRPFYNERAVRVWLVFAALVAVAATLFNVSRVLRYSRSDTQLATQASRDEGRAGDLRQQAARLRAAVDVRQIDRASNEARQANELIDRRTFSWTDMFNRFETTLPDDVRIVAVRPRIEPAEGIVLGVTVLARRVEDLDKFMKSLEQTGGFANMRPIEERADDSGLIESTIEARYIASAVKPASGEGTANP
jgi:Tfp pilus assembly protein PilN